MIGEGPRLALAAMDSLRTEGGVDKDRPLWKSLGIRREGHGIEIGINGMVGGEVLIEGGVVARFKVFLSKYTPDSCNSA